jgi:hypothetical protein
LCPSVAGVVEHPVHAEFVAEFAVSGAPEALVERDFDLAAGGEAIEDGVDLLVAAAVEAKHNRVAGMEGAADHVGAHEQAVAVPGQGAMEDEGAFFGGHFGGHGGFGDFLEFEIAIEAFLVEKERFAALAIEIQVRDQLCHGGRIYEVKLAAFIRIEGVYLRQFKGLFTTGNGLIFIWH